VVRFRVDPERSSVTAVVRPQMGLPALPATVDGHVDLDPTAIGAAEGGPGRAVEPGELVGVVQISLDGQPPTEIDLALAAADTSAELSRGGDDELVLRGQRSAPADAFGILGPPLVNPTLLLSWRLVLHPT
jgi:hypothetical protein